MSRTKNQLRFIDLFAGIGGTRLAFEKAGSQCVFSSEWDTFAAQTYEVNFLHRPEGDITKIPSNKIPSHDILVAGFPCQPFSISGVSKKNSLGKPHGFDDPTQGTLFYEVKRILADKKPDAFLLENVKNLVSHDHGNTMRVILRSLVVDLGYYVTYRVIDAVNYVPQHRERIYIVGFKKEVPFMFPLYTPTKKPRLKDLLDKRIPAKYTLTDHLWTYLQNYAEKHRQKGNGFGYGLSSLESHTRTLSARYHKDGSEILIPQRGKNPRRLTPRECARLMGFPDTFKIPVSDSQAYRQFGNSVVVPLVGDIAESIIGALQNKVPFKNSQHYKLISEKLYEPTTIAFNERVSIQEHFKFK